MMRSPLAGKLGTKQTFKSNSGSVATLLSD